MTQQVGITLLIYIMGLFLFVERPFEEENSSQGKIGY